MEACGSDCLDVDLGIGAASSTSRAFNIRASILMQFRLNTFCYIFVQVIIKLWICLLYTSDAADE